MNTADCIAAINEGRTVTFLKPGTLTGGALFLKDGKFEGNARSIRTGEVIAEYGFPNVREVEIFINHNASRGYVFS